METTTQINRAIKRELSKLFPDYKIRVNQGRGTAGGWKTIDISEIPRPHNCYCNSPAFIYYCQNCQEGIENINKAVWEKIRKFEDDFSYFYSDDGYSTRRSRVIISIHFRD